MAKNISTLAVGELTSGIKRHKYKIYGMSIDSILGSDKVLSKTDSPRGLDAYFYAGVDTISNDVLQLSREEHLSIDDDRIYDNTLELVSLRIYSPEIDGNIVNTRTLGA